MNNGMNVGCFTIGRSVCSMNSNFASIFWKDVAMSSSSLPSRASVAAMSASSLVNRASIRASSLASNWAISLRVLMDSSARFLGAGSAAVSWGSLVDISVSGIACGAGVSVCGAVDVAAGADAAMITEFVAVGGLGVNSIFRISVISLVRLLTEVSSWLFRFRSDSFIAMSDSFVALRRSISSLFFLDGSAFGVLLPLFTLLLLALLPPLCATSAQLTRSRDGVLLRLLLRLLLSQLLFLLDESRLRDGVRDALGERDLPRRGNEPAEGSCCCSSALRRSHRRRRTTYGVLYLPLQKRSPVVCSPPHSLHLGVQR